MLRDQAGSAREALARTQQVMTKLGLTLSEEKTAVQDARREPFEFLGYSFGPHRYHKDGHWYLGRARQRRAYSGSRPGSVTSWFPVTWEHGPKSLISVTPSSTNW